METKERIQQKIISFLISTCRGVFQRWDIIVTVCLCACMVCGAVWYCLRKISPEEQASRLHLVQTAEIWLGSMEADGSHQTIIDLYNNGDPLPRNYSVSYDDNWCAAFASAAAIAAGMDDLIPMECSCEQQINLFMAQGNWREDECYLPRTGDYIYYVWDEWRRGDCTAWANHVGIVADTFGPVIKVIEGNQDDAVGYRYIFLNDICIRGFGLPDY